MDGEEESFPLRVSWFFAVARTDGSGQHALRLEVLLGPEEDRCLSERHMRSSPQISSFCVHVNLPYATNPDRV